MRKRLKTLLPILIESMERHDHIDLATEIYAKLLPTSAVTIDRALRCAREQSGRQRVSGLGRSGARFRRGRACCSQRPFGAGQFRPDALTDIAIGRLHGMRAPFLCARTEVVERGSDRDSQAATVSAPGSGH